MIAALLTSILKIIRLSEESAQKVFRAGNNKVVWGDGSRADETVKNLSKSKMSKNEKFENLMHIKATENPTFLTLDTRETFNHLRQAFIETSIL